MERSRLLAGGALGTAIAASICCFGPLFLAIAGLGGGALLLRLTPLRPYFLAATGLLLAGAFVFTYRRSDECEPGESCTIPRVRKLQRILLWIATILVVVIAAFPYYSKYLFQ